MLLQQIAATRNYAEREMTIQAAMADVKHFAMEPTARKEVLKQVLRPLLLRVASPKQWVNPYVMEAVARVVRSFADLFNDTVHTDRTYTRIDPLLDKLLEHVESSGDLGHSASRIWLALAPQTQLSVIVALLDVFAAFAPRLEARIVNRLVVAIGGLARPRRMYGNDPIRASLLSILQRSPGSPSGSAARARLALSNL